MASDNLSRTMKIISTVTLGHLAGITSYKSSCLVPSLEEQSDITAAAKVSLQILSSSIHFMILFYKKMIVKVRLLILFA